MKKKIEDMNREERKELRYKFDEALFIALEEIPRKHFKDSHEYYIEIMEDLYEASLIRQGLSINEASVLFNLAFNETKE